MQTLHLADCPSTLIDSEEIRLLAELGFMGGNLGHSLEATSIFQSMETLRPGAVFIELGHAMARMGKGDYRGAAERLANSSIVKHPDDEDLRILLAWALFLDKRTDEARVTLAPLVDSPAESPQKRLAIGFYNGLIGQTTSLASLAALVSSALRKHG